MHDIKSHMLQDYIHSIGSCLLQMNNEEPDGPVTKLMQKLTDESSRLLGCIKLLNHKVHDAMLHGRMDAKLADDVSMDRYYPTSTVCLDQLYYQVSCRHWHCLAVQCAAAESCPFVACRRVECCSF